MQAQVGRRLIGFALLGLSCATAQQPEERRATLPNEQGVAPIAIAADGPRLGVGEAIPAAELEAFIDGFVRSAMVEHNIVGASVSVVQDGQVVLEQGYGYADWDADKPVDPDATLFRIGSITKTFTWIALMNEVEAGRVGVDDPVNDHLPTELQIPDQGFQNPIRVRDLMTHSPGFEDRALGVLFIREPEKITTLTEFLRDTRPDRVREPGVLSSYSNYGAGLAGAIVEHSAGRPWQEVVENEILGPLGMTNSSVREPHPARDGLPAPMPEDLADKLATGFRWSGANGGPQPFEYITQVAPAGAASSTASDMARYMLMLLGDGSFEGRRIFGPEAARAFREPMTSLPPAAGNWAGGFAVSVAPGGFDTFSHDGATLTHFSSMTVTPELQLGVFSATNTVGGAALTSVLWREIIEHFYATPTPPAEGAPDQVAAMQAYAGAYLSTRREYGGLAGALFRLQVVPVTVSPEGFLLIQLPGPPPTYVPTGKPGVFLNTSGRGEIVFEDRGGRMTAVALGVGLERVGVLGQPQLLLLVCIAAAIAAAATLIGVLVRLGRGLPRTSAQGLAGRMQTAAAALWVVAGVSLGIFLSSADERLVFSWPTGPVLAFSAAALVASLLSAAILVFLPSVWLGAPAPAGWTAWRKARFTTTAVVFAVFAVMLAVWGTLQPWNP